MLTALAEDVQLVIHQALTDADPMAEIAAKFQISELREQATGNPGIVEDAAAMRLVGDGQLSLGFNVQRLFKKLDALGLAPGVSAGMAVDELGIEQRGGCHRLPK